MNLDHNLCLYADILECKRANGKILYEREDAVLVQGRYSSILYSAAATQQAGKDIAEHLPKHFEILVTHDTYTDVWLKTMHHVSCEMECVHSVYPSKTPCNVMLPKGFLIRRLNASHKKQIIAMYRHSMASLANETYISRCLEDGMYGVFCGTQLCGCIGVHEKESMGILEIHPHWRRKGLGVALVQFMVNQQIKRERIPYGEIAKENTAGIQLQKKAGMLVSNDLTYWYFS